MRWIYVLSPHHTGTWFTLAFLRDHPEIDGFTQVGSPQVTLRRAEPLYHELKSDGTSRLLESIGETTLLHSHICLADETADIPRLHRFQEALAVVSNPVVPLRDPVRALLTTVNRKDPSSLNLEMRRWAGMVVSLQDLYPLVDPAYLPVDNLPTEHDKMVALGLVLGRLGIEAQEHARRWGAYWPTGLNSSGDYEAKRRYASGDVDYIIDKHPDVWDQAVEWRKLLQPFFVERGYERLPWYE